MKKVKKADGSIVEVQEDYKLEQGEAFEPANLTDQLKPVFDALSQGIVNSAKENKIALEDVQRQMKETETKLHQELAKLIQTPATPKPEFTPEVFLNHRIKYNTYHKEDPMYRFAVGLQMWGKGDLDKAIREKNITLATTDIMGTDTAALGGALVPVGYELQMRADTGKYSLFGELVKPIQTNFSQIKMARRTSGSTTYIQAEKVAATRSKPAVENVTLYVELITTAIESSRQLLEDTEGLINALTVDAADSRGKYLDTAWLTASGHVTGTTLCTGLANVSDAQIVYGGSAASVDTSNVTYETINSMVTKINPRNRGNCAFIFNPAVMGVIREIKDGSNRPIFNEFIGVGDNNLTVMGRMFGIPVYESYALPGLAPGTNTVFGILADVQKITKARYKTGMSVEPVFFGVNADGVDLQSAYEFKLYVRERMAVENFADLDVDGENHQICVLKTTA